MDRCIDFRGSEDEAFCAAVLVYKEKRMNEQSEDFILPDYLPDIRKIAGVFPSAVIKGRFLGSGTLEYDGEVCYRILYIADDGSMKSAVFLSGFEDKVGGEVFEEHLVDILTPQIEGVTVRMLNPRKLNIRSQVGADIALFKRKCHMPELYGSRTLDDEKNLECKIEECPTVNVLNLRENGLTLSEDLSFDAAMPTAGELVFATAVLYPRDCRVNEGEAQIRGVAEIYSVFTAEPVQGGNGKPEIILFNRTVSFSQVLKNEQLHEGGVSVCALSIEGAEFRLREDEFGQKRVLEADMTYCCDLTVYYPKNLLIVTDSYSLDKDTDLSYTDKCHYSLIAPLNGGFSVNETVTLDLPEDGGYSLVGGFVLPELHLASEASADGKAVLEGEATVWLLLKDSAGALDARRTSIPLRFRTEIPYTEGAIALVNGKAGSERMRLDGKTLSVDFEMSFSGVMLKEENASSVDCIRILKEERRKIGNRGSVLLYYPDKEEALFDIAKKYATRPSSLVLEENGDAPLLIRCK